ncbi:MAG: hypothetical protein GOVbin4162_122 [Prokaryotic dsDNA virus sp.]|nr:MAG: hypothetical protein GOVbin4162_122 [Prokaryotic dsDNA virus sp.]|tara:strand:- start:1453 stop:1668 length:216 start_codon:yes stop_codon:yes gene_type:complete
MTEREQLNIIHGFFHTIQMYSITCNNPKMQEAVNLICNWSRAHREGNGELTYEEQKERVEKALRRMEEFTL